MSKTSLITQKDVEDQSNQVFNQFGYSKWIPYAQENVKLDHRHPDELRNIGIGKVLISVAMGESAETHVPLLKKYRDRFDILTCDKGFGFLLKEGIKPDYVMICDCNIRMKWIEDYIQETKDIKLISTVYGNPNWVSLWKGPRYFYINKDAINSQRHFIPIFGDQMRIIPASTNVSNAMIVFMTGCDERNNGNWAGYERYLLTGYDYSWRENGKYYAWEDPKPKRYYMTHRTLKDINNDNVRTSENLFFSVKWFFSYLNTFKPPVINCSERGILYYTVRDKLENQLKNIREDKKPSSYVKDAFETAKAANAAFQSALKQFTKLREDIYYGYR